MRAVYRELLESEAKATSDILYIPLSSSRYRIAISNEAEESLIDLYNSIAAWLVYY